MLRKMIAGLVLVGFVAGCAEEAKKTPAKGAAPAATPAKKDEKAK